MNTNITWFRRGKHSLAGRYVLITGASSGIGRATALAVSRCGAQVLLLARRPTELAEVVAEVRAAGGEAFGYPCDITDPESVAQVIETVLATHGQVDMLVNNAGRSIRRALHRSADRMHDFERTMAVNYFGAVRLTMALLPAMRERRFGHIVQISSSGVQTAAPRFAAYVASKAALDKFTEVAAAETVADGVTFTTVHLPLIRTPMIAPSGYGRGVPVRSPEWAADLIVRALIRRPKRIDTPGGTVMEYWSLFAPKLKDRVLHRYYRSTPDSPAAKGKPVESTTDTSHTSSWPASAISAGGWIVRRVGVLLPGVHW